MFCRYNAGLDRLQPQDHLGWQCSLADGKVLEAKRIVGDLRRAHAKHCCLINQHILMLYQLCVEGKHVQHALQACVAMSHAVLCCAVLCCAVLCCAPVNMILHTRVVFQP